MVHLRHIFFLQPQRPKHDIHHGLKFLLHQGRENYTQLQYNINNKIHKSKIASNELCRAASLFGLYGKYSKNVKLGSRLIGPPEEYLTFWSDPAVLSSPPPLLAPRTCYMHNKSTDMTKRSNALAIPRTMYMYIPYPIAKRAHCILMLTLVEEK